MKKAGIYRRVSTDEQIDGTSLGSQEADGRRTAQAEAYDVVEVYSDEGISGTVYDRPELQCALADLEAGKIDALICWDVSRLSRNVEHQQRILRRIRSAGGRLILCRGGFEDTDEGDLMFGISGSFAQYERRVFRSRSMRGRKALAESGVQPSRAKPPFGFVIVTNSHKIEGLYPDRRAGDYVLIEDQARWVREIFRLFAAGWSLNRIASYLNMNGVPTPKGGECWRATSVRVILMNPTYAGKVVFGRTQSVGDEGLTFLHDPTRKVKNGKRNLARPEADWTTVATEITPLIDAETWGQCAARMAQTMEEKQAISGGNPSRKFMLSGLVFCPSCGWRIGGNSDKRVNTRHYVCDTERGCRAKKRRYEAGLLEHLLMMSIQYVHEHPDSVADALRGFEIYKRAQAEGGQQEQERERLTAELEALQTKAKATAQAMTSAVMVGASADDFAPQFSEIGARRHAIEGRLKELVPVERKGSAQDVRSVAEKLATVAGAIVKVFKANEEDYSPAEKRALLLPLVDRVTPSEDGTGLYVAWKSETLHYVTIYCSPVLSM